MGYLDRTKSKSVFESTIPVEILIFNLQCLRVIIYKIIKTDRLKLRLCFILRRGNNFVNIAAGNIQV